MSSWLRGEADSLGPLDAAGGSALRTLQRPHTGLRQLDRRQGFRQNPVDLYLRWSFKKGVYPLEAKGEEGESGWLGDDG